MAICGICGESAGLAREHGECRMAVNSGKTPQDVRDNLRVQESATAAAFPAVKIGIVAGISAALTLVAVSLVYYAVRFLFDLGTGPSR